MKITTALFQTALTVVFAASITGCATTVDKTEVQQAKNPVGDLHAEVQKAQTANSLEWYNYGDALVKAGKEKKFVVVDFYANWCKWCKKLDSDTFTDPRVAEALKASFVPVKIDAESSKPVVVEMKQMTMQELADSYSVSSYPSLWFIDPNGEKAKLLNGYLPPDAFLQYLAYIYSGKYKDMEFEDYVMKGAGK